MRQIVASLLTLLLWTSVALAQGNPPVEGAPANTPGGSHGTGSAWWLIVVVLVAIAAVWYFARNRNRT